MNDYTWKTEEPLADNALTMQDFLDGHIHEYCDEDYEVIEVEGSYAEIENKIGVIYGLHASGNGDFCNHRIRFEHL